MKPRVHRRRTKIIGQFAPRLIEMLCSPAHRVASLSCRRVIERIEIEMADHGGRENGKLPVTYDDFVRYGIDRHAIAPALREAIALGFVEVTQRGRAGNREFRRPSLYRLTFRETDDAEPTNEWRRIKTVGDAQAKAKAARLMASKKQKASGGRRRSSVQKPPTENDVAPVGIFPITSRVGPPPTTLDISVQIGAECDVKGLPLVADSCQKGTLERKTRDATQH